MCLRLVPSPVWKNTEGDIFLTFLRITHILVYCENIWDRTCVTMFIDMLFLVFIIIFLLFIFIFYLYDYSLLVYIVYLYYFSPMYLWNDKFLLEKVYMNYEVSLNDWVNEIVFLDATMFCVCMNQSEWNDVNVQVSFCV